MATKTNTTVNGKDYFRIQRVIGEKGGKPVKKSFYGRNKKEAEKKYNEFKEEQIRQKYEKALRADLSDFSERADEFIENALKPSQKYAQGTIDRYVSAYNTHIKGTKLSKKIAKDITPSDIQKFYNDLDVSKQTIRQVHKFMSAFYKWMVRNGYSNDVLSAVEIPKKKNNKRHEDIVIWDEDELDTIISNLGNHRLRFLVYLFAYTGMRVGETLGLKYSDIKGDTIHVKRQYYVGEIKDPKSNSSRDIPMHPVLIDELKRHKEWHKREMRKKGYRSDFIFTTDSGKLVETGNLRRSLLRYYARIGIEPKHNHAYRSTFCTMLCKNGVPIEVASKILGHKNIGVTARHYALVQSDSKRDAIESLPML